MRQNRTVALGRNRSRFMAALRQLYSIFIEFICLLTSPRINRPDQCSLLVKPGRFAAVVFRRKQWRFRPCLPKIERTARNDKIISRYICHDYRRGVLCIVHGYRSRQCRRRLYSKQPYFEHTGTRGDDRLEPGEPLGCFVLARESHLDFGPGHTDVHSSHDHG